MTSRVREGQKLCAGLFWCFRSVPISSLPHAEPDFLPFPGMAPRRSMSTTKVISVVLGLVLLFATASALTTEEIAGLQSLSTIFSGLDSIPSAETYSDEGVYLGSSWDLDSIGSACSSGEGWGYHGVHCNSAGQIDEIYLYAPPHASLSLSPSVTDFPLSLLVARKPSMTLASSVTSTPHLPISHTWRSCTILLLLPFLPRVLLLFAR